MKIRFFDGTFHLTTPTWGKAIRIPYYRQTRSYFTLRFVSSLFTDHVSGKTVCLYQDCYGDFYLKDSRWAFFQVKQK